MHSLEEIDLMSNPEPRCACLLLLDTSGSMANGNIQLLNAGVSLFKEEVMKDPLARKRVDVGIVTFGGRAMVRQAFQGIESFKASPLSATGRTPMGEALSLGLEQIRERKQQYRKNNLNYYRPWLFLFTDGLPTDNWMGPADAVAQAESGNELVCFCVGTADADFETLRKVSTHRSPLRLDRLKFNEMFLWLSNSLKSVSNSSPGENASMASPAEWGSIPT